MLNNHINSTPNLLIVGDYLFDAGRGLLSGPSGAHYICSRLVTLLGCLLERSGEIVDRDYLANTIWKDDPNAHRALNQCIARLRHYFEDNAKAANYIETVPHSGYRLVAPVYGSTDKPVFVRPAVETGSRTTVGVRLYRLFREFRERKVCRSMLIYTIVIWLVFQVSEIIVPALSFPEWVNGLVVVLGLLGFPVAAALSWIFDLTPSGIVRDPTHAPAARAAASRKWTELALDSALISVALVMCGMLVLTSLG